MRRSDDVDLGAYNLGTFKRLSAALQSICAILDYMCFCWMKCSTISTCIIRHGEVEGRMGKASLRVARLDSSHRTDRCGPGLFEEAITRLACVSICAAGQPRVDSAVSPNSFSTAILMVLSRAFAHTSGRRHSIY